MTKKADLIIKGGKLVTFDEENSRFDHGTVAVKDGLIAAVGDESTVTERYEADRTIDAGGGLIMPGFINGHTHAAMSVLRGYADDLPLDRWLKDYIFPAESKLMNDDMVYWGSLVSAAEMLHAGVTTCADAYFFASSAARAFRDAGIRAVAAQGILDGPQPQWENDARRAEVLHSYLDQFKNMTNDLVTPALFVHAAYTASPETYQLARELCDEHDALLFTHLAESEGEVSEIKRRYGVTPVRHLAASGVLSDRFVAVHAVHVDPEEIEIMSQYGVSVIHCPGSNAKLGNGLAPVPAMLTAGIPVGLGTDGPASNNRQDLFFEMDFCAKGHKLSSRDPAQMNARTILSMALFMGAEVLDLEDRVGCLAAGKAADIIILSLAGPHASPLFCVESHLVYAARGSDVLTTIVGGKVVYHEGKITTFDEGEASARIVEIVRPLK